MMESIISHEQMEQKTVDREKTCPLLLRVFCNTGRHNPPGEYSRGSTPANELQIYTWMDATLKELTSLIKEVNPETRRRGTLFDFAIVSPQLIPRFTGYRMRDIGTTMTGVKGADDSITLQGQKFVIGDYLDVAITPPQAPPPPSRGRMMMRPY